jgi:hypothetical protein
VPSIVSVPAKTEPSSFPANQNQFTALLVAQIRLNLTVRLVRDRLRALLAAVRADLRLCAVGLVRKVGAVLGRGEDLPPPSLTPRG